MDIRYSEKSLKQLQKIQKGDSKGAETIVKTIEAYAEEPTRNFDVKSLKGKLGALKRLRIGSYRAIFEGDGAVIFVFEIKHRKEVYR